jgi:hypothetical protein
VAEGSKQSATDSSERIMQSDCRPKSALRTLTLPERHATAAPRRQVIRQRMNPRKIMVVSEVKRASFAEAEPVQRQIRLFNASTRR